MTRFSRLFPRALTTVAVACVAVLCVAAPANAALAPVFGPADPLSDSNENVKAPELASAGGTVVAVWTDTDESNQILKASVHTASTGWSLPIRISDAGENIQAGEARIVADKDGNFTVVWKVTDTWYFKTRTLLSGAEDWLPATANPATTIDSTGGVTSVRLAANPKDGSVVAAWGSYHMGNSVRVMTRAANSAAWGEPMDIEQDGDNPRDVAIAFNASGDGIAVWDAVPDGDPAHQIRSARFSYALRENEHHGWSGVTPVVTTGNNDNSWVKVALAPDGSATAVWVDGDTSAVTVISVPAGNLDWVTPALPLNDTAHMHAGLLPEIASDRAGNMVLVYQDMVFSEDYLAMYASSVLLTRTRNAKTGHWTENAEPLSSLSFSGAPRLAVNQHYDIAISMLTADAVDMSRIGDAVVPNINLAVAYRADGESTFSVAPVVSGDVNMSAGVPSVTLDDDGQLGTALAAADAGTARHATVVLGTAPPRKVATPPADVVDAPPEDVVETPPVSKQPVQKAKIKLPPVIPARLSGRKITITTTVPSCSGKFVASTRFGTTKYQTKLKLTKSGKVCTGAGVITLKKTPSTRTKLRVAIGRVNEDGTDLVATLTTKRA